MRVLPKQLERLISNLESLPGIGPRGAARIAFFLLRAPKRVSSELGESIAEIKDKIGFCANCYNFADERLCPVCSDPERDNNLIMVVEDPLDIAAMERGGKYNGVYHVLGGVISPVNGIGPEEIRIKELLNRLKDSDTSEIILATNPNLEGESTAIYIKNEVSKLGDIKLTRLARGLPTGADLEYADDITLERALTGREAF